MTKLLFVLFALISNITIGQTLAGIEWFISRDFYILNQDTIDIYNYASSNNTIDFEQFRIQFNSNGTYDNITINGQNGSGQWQTANGNLILDNLDTSGYTLLPNGDLLLSSSFLTYDAGSGTYSIPADAYTLLKNSTALPVEILRFYAETVASANKITWLVNELGVQHYHLERSNVGGGPFREIVSFSSSGNGLSHKYTFEDLFPNNRNYYRLRINYWDGKVEYSNMIFVENKNEGICVKNIFPIPARDKLFIEINTPDKGHIILRVCSVTGASIKKEEYYLEKENDIIELDLKDLFPGLYFFELFWDNFRFTTLKVGKR